MVEMFQLYHRYGFDGPLRPDHAPAMYGETQGSFGGSTTVGYEITEGICHRIYEGDTGGGGAIWE